MQLEQVKGAIKVPQRQASVVRMEWRPRPSSPFVLVGDMLSSSALHFSLNPGEPAGAVQILWTLSILLDMHCSVRAPSDHLHLLQRMAVTRKAVTSMMSIVELQSSQKTINGAFREGEEAFFCRS